MWLDSTFYDQDDRRYAVCYRHLMRRVRHEAGDVPTFAFRLNPKDYSADAFEWVTAFGWEVKRQGEVILASLENPNDAHICAVAYQECGNTSLLIELEDQPRRPIKISARPAPKDREFYPEAFSKPDDLWANSVLDGIGPSRQQIEKMKLDEAIWRRGRS